MIDRLKEILKTDGFIPSSSVFPDIDTDHIARDLKLQELGRDRGRRDLPQENEKSHDGIEMGIISRIDEARRKGLQNYENNREAYTRRLAGASSAHLEVKTIAGSVKGDFNSEVKNYRGKMTGPVDELKRWASAVDAFQTHHKLTRPAFQDANPYKTAFIVLIFVVIETILNGYLFAQKNELGLLGGALVALLVSIVNVGISAIAGFFSHFWIHRNVFLKLLGACIVLAWICIAFALNLGIAHFRDSVETLDGWAQAAQSSMQTMIATPFALQSIESWLLMIWGCLIALGTFLKFVFYGEPYPGYGRISARYREALDHYCYLLEDALESLKDSRDTAAQNLQDANDTVRDQIGDAIDALYGQRMMTAHLGAFLQQCDLKVTSLLKIYRDENRAERETNAPAHFDDTFEFAPFTQEKVESRHRADAEKEVDKIAEIINDAIEEIHQVYNEMLDDYPDPDRLIGVDMQKGIKSDDAVRRKDRSDLSRQASA